MAVPWSKEVDVFFVVYGHPNIMGIQSQTSWVPSGKHTKKLWKITNFNGKTHYRW
jgi:hypothetical protein